MMMRASSLFFVTLMVTAALAGCASNNGTTPTGTTATPSAPPTPTVTPSVTPTSPVPNATGFTCPTAPPGTPAIPVGTPILQLKLGTLMPLTGALSTLGGDMQRGAQLAIREINCSNVGVHVTEYDEDDKTSDPNVATTFQRLVSDGVTAVAGPCCSGVTSRVLDLAVQDQVVVASPSATSPSLVEPNRQNSGYFWRVSPSDAVQGKVLANLVKGDGITSVAVILVNNPYGNGLSDVFGPAFSGLGGNVLTTQKYNEQNTGDFSSQVTAVCGTSASALVIFGYIQDGANILKEMNKQGCRSKFQVYGSEGLYDSDTHNGLPDKAGQDSAGNWLAAGVKGTNPQTNATTTFRALFNQTYGHDPAQYSAESYDAVMYVALAALEAKSVKGADIKTKLRDVANAPGTSCSGWAQCAGLIVAGQDVNYAGAAHDFDFSEKNEPTKGVYSVWQVGTDGVTKTIQYGLTA